MNTRNQEYRILAYGWVWDGDVKVLLEMIVFQESQNKHPVVW